MRNATMTNKQHNTTTAMMIIAYIGNDDGSVDYKK